MSHALRHAPTSVRLQAQINGSCGAVCHGWSESAAVLVADPDEASRGALAGLLQDRGFEVTAVPCGRDALVQASHEPFAIAILEIHLPDITGYEVCRALRDSFGEDPFIVFVSARRTEAADRVAGLMLGADDYLAKPFAGDELVARLRSMLRRAGRPRAGTADEGKSALTARELEVLQLLAAGLDQRAIAGELVITPHTVAKHIEHILIKLPARSRAEAVAIAYQRGLSGAGAGA